MTPLTRAEVQRIRDTDREWRTDAEVRDLADTALALMTENERLRNTAFNLAKDAGEAAYALRTAEAERDDALRALEAERSFLKESDKVLMPQLAALRTAEARIQTLDGEANAYKAAHLAAEARIAALRGVIGEDESFWDAFPRWRGEDQAMDKMMGMLLGVRALLSEPQDGEGGTPEADDCYGTEALGDECPHDACFEAACPCCSRTDAPTSPPASQDAHFRKEGQRFGQTIAGPKPYPTSPPAEPTPDPRWTCSGCGRPMLVTDTGIFEPTFSGPMWHVGCAPDPTPAEGGEG